MIMEDSKSNKKSYNNQMNMKNQKLMMKISSSKNGSGNIVCFILLGGALMTAALGSAFLVERKRRKSNKKITKNEKIEDESSKGLHFLVPHDSSPCMQEEKQPSCSGTEYLGGVNDSTTLFSTPCFIQDEKPKLKMDDEKRDAYNIIVSDHPKEEEKSQSLERLPVPVEELELAQTKILLLPDPDQQLNEVSDVRNVIIQRNETSEVPHVHQAQATIFYNPSLLVENKSEFLIDDKHNDKEGISELQHTDMIERDDHEEGLIQEQEKQAPGDQEIINPDDSYPESCTSSEQELFGQGDQAIEAIDLMKAADEDEDKGHIQIMYFQEQSADADTQTDQIAKKCILQMQVIDEQEYSKEDDQASSCYEEATSENRPCRSYSMAVQNLEAAVIKNDSIDFQHSAEVIQVIKEIAAKDTADSGEQSLEAKHSSIQLVGKQRFETDCRENAVGGDKGASESQAVDIAIAEKDLEAHSTLAEDEVAESVFVYEEDNYTDKDDTAVEVEDDISEGAGNSSEQSKSDKIWPADSNQELLLELKEKKVKDEDEGMKIEEDEMCSAETRIDQIARKCNLQMQFNDEQESPKDNDQANSCYEEAITENSPHRTYSMVVQNLAASAIRNASLRDQHSADVIQVIKETDISDSSNQHSAEVIQDAAAFGEQGLEAEHSPIQLVEKQSFEPDCQGCGLVEDKGASDMLTMDIEVVDKDLQEYSIEKGGVAEGVFEEEDEDDDDDYDNDIKDDAAEVIDDDISEGAGNSSEQSNGDKIWPADSNEELLSVLKEKNVKEDEEGTETEDETCDVDNSELKSTQNNLNITSCQQSYDGKDDSTVNAIERYRTKLMYQDDVAVIATGRRMFLGALLVLMWYLILQAFSLPSLVDS